MSLTVQEILAMKPGKELDQAVHRFAMGRPGPAPAYSTKSEVAVGILAHLHIGVAQLSPKTPGYKPERPFVAFSLDRGTPGTFVTTVSVTAATLPLALSKMALLQATPASERAQTPVGHFPGIGTALKARTLDPMPIRKPPATPTAPAAPTVV